MSFDLKILSGDLVLSNTGDLGKVDNTEKLIQDILKIATTPIGGNSLIPWYGSSINRTLIGNSLETKFICSLASDQLRSALETLKKLQGFQSQTMQIVSPQEQIAAVKNVVIERNSVNPSYFRVSITVLSKALNEVPTGFLVTP